jgi:MYXO-CTERM domain-containing protein
MSRITVVSCVLALAGTASAASIADNPEASFTSLESTLGVTLQSIDMSSQPISVSGANNSLNGQNNVLVSNFTGLFSGIPIYDGVLTSEVFADAAAPGTDVANVVIKYTFTNAGSSANSIETFNFGVNSGVTIDLTDLEAATHGTIQNETSFLPNGANPLAVSTDNGGGNNTFDFDFRAAGDLEPGETLTWYVAASGDVRVNVVDVTITNFENTTAKALVFTTTEGQDDLNVPAPGVATLGALGLAAASRRRRR